MWCFFLRFYWIKTQNISIIKISTCRNLNNNFFLHSRTYLNLLCTVLQRSQVLFSLKLQHTSRSVMESWLPAAETVNAVVVMAFILDLVKQNNAHTDFLWPSFDVTARFCSIRSVMSSRTYNVIGQETNLCFLLQKKSEWLSYYVFFILKWILKCKQRPAGGLFPEGYL